jgi:flagellar motility protein MotE (MotC chaperone)
LDDYSDPISSGSTYKPPETPKTPKRTAYVLYDRIPRPKEIVDKYKVWNGYDIDVPICVIIFHPVKFSLDNIYLFFNNEATSDDMLSMVKLLLGIKGDFSLDPPIKTKETTEEEEKCEDCFLKRTFIKLERCQSRTELLKQGKFPKLTYCVNSMDINLWWRKDKGPMTVEKLIDVKAKIHEPDSNTTDKGFELKELELVKKTTHEIRTKDETYKDLDGKKIREQLEKKYDKRIDANNVLYGVRHFVESVKESKACLPDLYKEFFKPKNPDEPNRDEDYYKGYLDKFYKEYYTKRDKEEELHSNTDETYNQYISKIRQTIVGDLMKRNNKYRLHNDSYKKLLEEGRPLRISEPFNYHTSNFTTHDAQTFVEAEWLLSEYNQFRHDIAYFPEPSYYSYRKKWYVEEEEEKKETDKVKQEITEMQNERYGPPPTPPTPPTSSPNDSSNQQQQQEQQEQQEQQLQQQQQAKAILERQQAYDKDREERLKKFREQKNSYDNMKQQLQQQQQPALSAPKNDQ